MTSVQFCIILSMLWMIAFKVSNTTSDKAWAFFVMFIFLVGAIVEFFHGNGS